MNINKFQFSSDYYPELTTNQKVSGLNPDAVTKTVSEDIKTQQNT